MHISVRWAHTKPRLSLRAIVEAEHRRDDAVQLVGEVDRSRPPAIGAAGMLECLQIHPECVVELSNRAGENDGAARRVLLDDDETLCVGKLSDHGNVCGIGAELPGKLFAAQMPIRPFARRQLRYAIFQWVGSAVAKDHTDFQPFRGIRLADRSCSPHRPSLTSDKRAARHR
jgi:hypothetical protein